MDAKKLSGSAPPMAAPRAVPLFGPGGWREQHADLYPSDSSARWMTTQYRQRFVDAGALGVFAGRMCAIEPTFTEVAFAIARERVEPRSSDVQSLVDAAFERGEGEPPPTTRGRPRLAHQRQGTSD